MSNFFFNFENFETEIKKKLVSQTLDTKILFNEFCKQLEKNIEINISEVKNLYSDLNKIPFNNVYKNYLSHPIRVAGSFNHIKKNLKIDDINFALSHNIIEHDFLKILPKKYLNQEQIKKISILTIDRKKEKDHSYLNQYYNKIENHSGELILFKALDKLDNVLGDASSNLHSRQIYIIKNELFPRMINYNSKIAHYLNELVDFIILNNRD